MPDLKAQTVQPAHEESHHDHEVHFLALNLAEWSYIFAILFAIASMAKIAHNWNRRRRGDNKAIKK